MPDPFKETAREIDAWIDSRTDPGTETLHKLHHLVTGLSIEDSTEVFDTMLRPWFDMIGLDLGTFVKADKTGLVERRLRSISDFLHDRFVREQKAQFEERLSKDPMMAALLNIAKMAGHGKGGGMFVVPIRGEIRTHPQAGSSMLSSIFGGIPRGVGHVSVGRDFRDLGDGVTMEEISITTSRELNCDECKEGECPVKMFSHDEGDKGECGATSQERPRPDCSMDSH